MDPFSATIVSNTAYPFARYSSYGNGNSAAGNIEGDDFNEQLSNFKASAAAYTAATGSRKRPASDYSSGGSAFNQPWSMSGETQSWDQTQFGNWNQTNQSNWNKPIYSTQQNFRGYAQVDNSNATDYSDMSGWTNPGYSSFDNGQQQASTGTAYPVNEFAEVSNLMEKEIPIPEGAAHDIFSPYYGIRPLHHEDETEGQEDDVTGPVEAQADTASGTDGGRFQSESYDDVNSLMRDAEMIAGVKSDADKNYTVSNETLKLVQEIEITVPSELMSSELCQLCNASFTNHVMAQSHYEGKKHAQKENQYIRKIYEEKGINVSRFLSSHSVKKRPTAVTEKKDKSKLKKYRFVCGVCSMCFETRQQADMHIMDVTHRKKVFDEQTELFNLQSNSLRSGNYGKRGRNDGYWGYNAPYGDNDDWSGEGDYGGNYRRGRGGGRGRGRGGGRGGGSDNYSRGGRGRGQRGGWTGDSWGGGGRGAASKSRPQAAPKPQVVGEYFCSVCNKVMNAVAQYEAHVASKKHLAKEAKMNESYEGY